MASVSRGIFLALCGLMAGTGLADSIKIGGVLHEDVYVGVSKQFYFVHFPDDGRVEKISRSRRDVEAPTIDSDEAAREAIRARFDARKEENDQERARAESTHMEGDFEAFERRKAVEYVGLFESQRDHWMALGADRQQRVLDRVLEQYHGKTARLAEEQVTIASRLESLGEVRSERADEADDARRRRERAISSAKLGSLEGFYGYMHEREVADYQMGNSPYVSDYYARRAGREQAITARRVQEARSTHDPEVIEKENAVARLDSAIRREERGAIAAAGKANDAERRFQTALRRIDELILSSQGEVVDLVAIETLGAWSSTDSLRTPPLALECEVWQLQCERNDFGLDSDFKITVVDASTGLPVTAITDKDFLEMRVLMFDRRGEFYFEVAQDKHRIPYTLTVCRVFERE